MSPESIDPILQLLLPIDPLRSLPEGTAILVKAAEIKGEKAIQFQGKLYPAVLPDNVKLGEMIKVVLQAKSDILLLKLLDRPEAIKSSEQQVLRALVSELRRNEVSPQIKQPYSKIEQSVSKQEIFPEQLYSKQEHSVNKQEIKKMAQSINKQEVEQLTKKVADTEKVAAQDFIAKKDRLKLSEKNSIEPILEQNVSERKNIENSAEIKIAQIDKKAAEEIKKIAEISVDKLRKNDQLINLIAPSLIVEAESITSPVLETVLKVAFEPKITERPKTEQVAPEQVKIVEERKDEIVRIIESVLKVVKKVEQEPQIFKALEFKPKEQLEKSAEKVIELVINSNEVLERIQEKRPDTYAVFPFFYGSIGNVVIGELLVRKNKKRRFRLFLDGFGELIVDIDDDKIVLTASSKETYLLLKDNINIVKSEFPGLEVIISLGQSGLLIPDFVQEKLSLGRRA